MHEREQPMLYSVDLSGCTRIESLSPDEVSVAFIKALTNAGATVVQALSHYFPGEGLTSVLILGAWAQSIFGTPAWPVTVTTAFSGADATAPEAVMPSGDRRPLSVAIGT